MSSSKITKWWTLLLALLFSVACSHQPSAEPSDDSISDSAQLPFERPPNRTGIPPTSEIRFQGIPAGTPVTVRLQSPLSSHSSHTLDAFQAVLDEPIIVQGKMLIPRGAAVSGRVVAARSSDGAQLPGYLRVTLSSIAVDGKTLPVQTNSIFAKGGAPLPPTAAAPAIRQALATGPAPAKAPPDVRFSVGTRFRFRLKETLPSQG